ncbi:FadR/GntR family transcriptional regulator [Castellaniella defragrans]|uniref:FadR/GntR family transcriptional regulator n=1 Tax=Castellaniella defragrans TaxID=75697 RepID=UPI0023F37692|nr:FadR/GntR family transcriptional regulator [Castellaniella defragrans]
MFPPRPSDQTRSYIHLAETLRQAIRELDIGIGGRLPSERELAQRLNVSRPSLREALIVLELQGEIEIRVGSGIYLRQPPESTPQKPASPVSDDSDPPSLGQSPHEVNQMRYLLEGSIAAHAARFIDKAQLRTLKDSIDAMQRALDADPYPGDQVITAADRKFHVCLAQVTENQLVINTVETLFDQRFSLVSRSLHRLFEDHHVWNNALNEHRDIYRAISERDPLQAQAAMQRHLTLAYDRLMTLIE